MVDLNDAFKQLNYLNEEVFDVTDNGIEELKDFKNNDAEVDVVEIADVDADTEEDLQDNYIGKVICQCNVCKSLIYSSADEIEIDPESQDKVNMDMECPYCYSSSGYKVIGEVAPFSGFQVDAEDEDGNKVDVEVTVNGKEIPQNSESDSNNEDFEYTPAEDLENLSIVGSKKESFGVKNESLRGRKMRRSRRYNESLDSIKLDDGTQEIEIKTKEKAIEDEEDGMIVPPSDETIEDIYSDEAETVEEAPSEELEPEAGDEVEADVEEIEEESFNRLGENYLKKVYSNVESFKTSRAYSAGNKIKLEGIIRFKSGKSKKTSFVFEAATINKRGTIKFLGENKDISRGKKSFAVTGALRHGKFFPESLTYNYRAKSLNENASKRVYGTVKVR